MENNNYKNWLKSLNNSDIENFIENLQGDGERGSWESYIDKQIIEDLDQIIYDENLNKVTNLYAAYSFVKEPSIPNNGYEPVKTETGWTYRYNPSFRWNNI